MMRSAGQTGKKFIIFSYLLVFTYAHWRELRANEKAYDPLANVICW